MLAFVIRRLVQAAVVMLVVAFIAFTLFQYVGDPVLSMLGQDATPEQRDELREGLGLNRPFYIQFGHFVANAVQGDFGLSYRQGRKVSTLIQERLPATIELSLVAAALALVVGVPMGVYTALRRKGLLSNLFLAISLVGASVIWRFVYAFAPEGQPQIGALNAIITGWGFAPLCMIAQNDSTWAGRSCAGTCNSGGRASVVWAGNQSP